MCLVFLWIHSQHSLRFVSGSKDGVAIIWTYSKRQWRTMKLRMSTECEELAEVLAAEAQRQSAANGGRAVPVGGGGQDRRGRGGDDGGGGGAQNGAAPSSSTSKSHYSNKYRVTMVCWLNDDRHVATAAATKLVKIWDSKTAEIVCVLKGHEDEVYMLERHPLDARILLSAGHDGQIKVRTVPGHNCHCATPRKKLSGGREIASNGGHIIF